MTVRRGEIGLADLSPTRGPEQSGTRPVVVFQNDLLSKYTATVLAIPLTTNLRRALLPSCVRITEGVGGLMYDSVALCHQLRVLDRTRLQRKLGVLPPEVLADIQSHVLFTLGIT